MKKYMQVKFSKQVKTPLVSHVEYLTGALDEEGYSITRAGSDYLITHEKFGKVVVEVPASSVEFAYFVDEPGKEKAK